MTSQRRIEAASPSIEGLFSIDGVADVIEVRGGDCGDETPACLLVEVPHGADRAAHYDALAARLNGPFPADLRHFFFANTDVGAWQYGLHVAEAVVAADPRRRAVAIRCLVPRTFVDTNRVAKLAIDASTPQLRKGAMTAGIPSYVTDDSDRRLLLDLHRRYVELVEKAFIRVVGGGGFGLIPHTYGPRTMGIAQIDEHIVENLHRAAEPEAWNRWPLRPEIDLLTRDKDRTRRAPDGIAQALIDAWRPLGYNAVDTRTYHLHPATQGYRWAIDYADRILCLEVRRDLLVKRFDLFAEMDVDAAAVQRVGGPIADWIARWLAGKDG